VQTRGRVAASSPAEKSGAGKVRSSANLEDYGVNQALAFSPIKSSRFVLNLNCLSTRLVSNPGNAW